MNESGVYYAKRNEVDRKNKYSVISLIYGNQKSLTHRIREQNSSYQGLGGQKDNGYNPLEVTSGDLMDSIVTG